MNVLSRLIHTQAGMIGLILLAIPLICAVSAPLLFPGDPLAIAGPALISPFMDFSLPFGSDRLGRDVLAGIFHGARATLLVGLTAALVAIFFGALIGAVAGFAGGVIDEVLMRLTDAFQTVPGFLLALAFVSVAGASLPVVVLAIALGAWTGPARLTRAEVLSIRSRDHVAAARVAGMRPIEIALREVLPNALPPVLALSSVIVANAMLVEAALSFLGLGDPNIVTWGSMIAEGRNVLRSAPYLSILPGLALIFTVLGVHLVSEGLADAFSARKVRL